MTIDNSNQRRMMNQNHHNAIIAKRQILGPPATHGAPAPAPNPAPTRDPATTAPTSAAPAPAPRTSATTTSDDPATRTTPSSSAAPPPAATDRSTRTVTSTSTSSRSVSTGLSVGALTLISNGLSASSGLLSISSDASASASASNANNGGGGGPSAGTVVGIVAGALVGVIFVSAVVGYVFRAKWGSSKEEEDRYGDVLKTRDEYRRESRMLGDGSDSASDFGGGKVNDRDMQSVSGSPVLNRSNTNRSNGSHYAPSLHHGHNPYLHPGMSAAPPLPPVMPSFRPGQVVNTPFYSMPPPPGSRALSPGPMMPQRTLSPGPMAYPGHAGPYQDFGAFFGQPPQPPRSPGPGGMGGYGELNRSPTHLQQGFGGAAPPPPHMQHMGGYGMGMPPNRTPSPLMRVQNQAQQEVPSRSGTPENSNVQMVFHRGHDSASVMGHGGARGGRESDGSAYGRQGKNEEMEGGRVEKDVRAKRTLSVRNGGLDDFGGGNGNGQTAKGGRPISTMTDASDAYGGM